MPATACLQLKSAAYRGVIAAGIECWPVVWSSDYFQLNVTAAMYTHCCHNYTTDSLILTHEWGAWSIAHNTTSYSRT